VSGRPAVDAALAARLAGELAAFRSPLEDPAARARLIDGALPRLMAALALLPPATATSRLLELGASPFLGSQCLDVVWPGNVTHASYHGAAERHGAQMLVEVGGTRTKTYEYDSFNIETDEFPYADGAFDVVLCTELIEHLAINPVWALAEIHRVLKPGGHLVLSTPNALAIERLESFLTGWRPDVDRYSPLLGYGARHNREWAVWELRLLLEETGFDVESIDVRDLPGATTAERVRRAVLRALVRPFSRLSRRAHVFLRARRRDRFRWRFPEALFSEARLYHMVRHPWVEMGVNDAIQCGEGWEPAGDEAGARRVRGVDRPLPGGSASVRGRAGAARVRVRLRGEPGAGAGDASVRIAVSDATHAVLGLDTRTVPRDRWTDVDVPLARAAVADEVLVVNVAVGIGDVAAVQRIALA